VLLVAAGVPLWTDTPGALQRNNFSPSAARKPSGDAGTHFIAQCPHRMVRTVDVAARNRKVAMPQEITDHEGVGAGLSGICAYGVTKVVEAHVL
jgi:hypothetical protein